MGRVFGISVGITDVLFPLKGIVHAVTGRDLLNNKENTAADYVATRLPDPLGFTGSNADLQALISSETDSCAAYVKGKGILTSGARETCANKVQLAYRDVIASRQAEEYQNDQTAMAQLFSGNILIWLVAIIVIIILIIIFKS